MGGLMRYLPLAVLFSALIFASCTKPPYRAPDKSLAEMTGDYTDCYTQASLVANTPPYPDSSSRVIHEYTDQCMKSRGYSGGCIFY